MNLKVKKWLVATLIMASPGIVNAQFNTIKKQKSVNYEIIKSKEQTDIKTDIQIVENPNMDNDTTSVELTVQGEEDVKTSQKCRVRKKHLGFTKNNRGFPELTIPNLLQEIRNNGILHERIVLAQAILETGWFTSSVCRNKNNLFGLTNPKTGNYYEFNHWTESVRAYYTKVQYRYPGGNYLLWLDQIGYAEDPRYISSLIRILRQYIL